MNLLPSDTRGKILKDKSFNIHLTFHKLRLQWYINQQKGNTNVDHSARIQFARFALERVSEKKVKLNMEK